MKKDRTSKVKEGTLIQDNSDRVPLNTSYLSSLLGFSLLPNLNNSFTLSSD